MKIAIASDHAGYILKSELKDFLLGSGYVVHDFGAQKLEKADDYPDYVFPAAKAVAAREYDRGIVIGGDGQGEAMAANRLAGVRCAVFYGPAMARSAVDIKGRISHDPFEVIRLSRLHNNSNVLSLGARFIGSAEAKQAVKLWLETAYLQEPRHERRNKKLDKKI